jgi:hypothetical protein
MTRTTLPDADRRGLRGFLDRGGFWRLAVVVVTYLAVYLGAGSVSKQLAGHLAEDDVLSSVGAVFFQLTFGLVVGAIVLVAFSSYMGWTGEMFDRQPVYRSRWMWIAPVTILVPIVLRVLGIDWGRAAFGVVALVLVSGLLVGFVEELLTRGIAVKMLRDGGHGEWTVAALSSLVFAASHSINLFGGQAVTTVALTVIYTFAFGVLMYLSMRVTGFLVAAMILHGLTDPTTIMATGGIDEIKGGSSNALLDAAGLFTFALVAIGFILLIFIRGRVSRTEPAEVDQVDEVGEMGEMGEVDEVDEVGEKPHSL